jgi:alpha-tubulin suppressor-like RCC1 family protein
MRTTLSPGALRLTRLLGVAVLLGDLTGCSLALQNDFDFPSDEDAGALPDASTARDGGGMDRDDGGTDGGGVVDGGGRVEDGGGAEDGGMPAECERASDCTGVPFATVDCDAGTCVFTCDAGREDCNGDPADGCEVGVEGDPAHCGACAAACTAAPGASVSCVSRTCQYACDAGRADCDPSAPGCETELGTSSACAGCGDACESGELCDARLAPAACGLDCPTPGTICGESCVDTGTSVAHCGGCGNACAPPNGIGVCAGSACGIVSCDTGYDDCNADPGDGCEVSLASDAMHCGACGRACVDGAPCVRGLCDPVVSVAPGPAHSCAIRTSGAALCWGTNEAGQLGDGTLVPHTVPGPAAAGFAFTQLTAGSSFTCGIERGTERLLCWGRNGYGELGDGLLTNRGVPAPVVARASDEATFVTRRFVAVRALGSGACALDSTGEVWCWGRNSAGEVGDGSTTLQSRAVRVVGVSGATALSAGALHVCALVTGGTLRCWGGNPFGALGDGTTTSRGVPAEVPGLTDVTALAALTWSTCALAGGQVWCWGRNAEGDLGLTGSASRPSPTDNGLTADRLACGAVHCFARTAEGWVAWGSRAYGEHGDGSEGAPRLPVLVPHDPAIVIVTSGVSRTSCRIVSDRLACWGIDTSGQIGARDLVFRTPAPVRSATDTVRSIQGIGAGNFATCLVVDGEVRCAGLNDQNVLARGGGFPGASAIPLAIAGIPSPARSVSVGRGFACAVAGEDGAREVWCWGNSPGIASSPFPSRTLIAAGEPIDVAAGYAHACARVREPGGDVVAVCWGTNGSGELGRGTTGAASATPEVVSGSPTDVAEIELGEVFGCLRRASGAVLCWGYNADGRVGDGTTTLRTSPSPVSGIATAVDLAVGTGFGCVLRSDASVVCWGRNGAGQLGDGTTASRSTPVPVAGLTGPATSVAAAGAHACALLGGRPFCWGSNSEGQLGAGDREPRSGIVAVGLTEAVALFGARGGESSASHTCALLTDGSARCWGMGLFGRCASGEALWSPTPLAARITD